MSPHWHWQYNGAPVQGSPEFRYLGIIFHETEGVQGAIQSLVTSARQAMWGMMSRFRVARMTGYLHEAGYVRILGAINYIILW
jgi:hypothetical protein